MKLALTVIFGVTGCLLASASFGADASAGKALFAQRCSVCRTAEAGDNGGAQGPSLIGLMGRLAGSGPQFSYTSALRDSKLTWDPATLKRFLASPGTVVPGTSMLVAVPVESERDNLIAYFQNAATHAAPAAAAVPAGIPASSV